MQFGAIEFNEFTQFPDSPVYCLRVLRYRWSKIVLSILSASSYLHHTDTCILTLPCWVLLVIWRIRWISAESFIVWTSYSRIQSYTAALQHTAHLITCKWRFKKCLLTCLDLQTFHWIFTEFCGIQGQGELLGKSIHSKKFSFILRCGAPVCSTEFVVHVVSV